MRVLNIRKCGLLTVIISLLFSSPLFADVNATTVLPLDSNPYWVIGITRFAAGNLSEENTYLASSLPLLVKEKIAGLRKHRISAAERYERRKAIIGAEIKKEVGNLLTLQKTRDEELFNETKAYQKQKINDDYNTTSAKIKERIKFLRELDPSTIAVDDEKEIKQKDDSGKLFAAPPFSPLRYAAEIGVDVVVWGSIEEIQGYLYLEVSIFSLTLEKNIFLFNEAGTPEEISERLVTAVPTIITALLGREWASLLVDVEPAFSFIKINSVLMGMGTVEFPYLEPGEITLEVQSPGYESEKKTISLKHLDSSVIQFSLKKMKEEFILVETIPGDADVYLNSLWIGKTPLVAERPEILTRLSIILSGYRNAYYRIRPDTPSSIMIPLITTALDFETIKEARRARFYSSFAMFLITLPLPIIGFGIARDFSAGHRAPEFEFFNATYYWTFFITGGLFLNAIYNLMRYIQSQNKPIG